MGKHIVLWILRGNKNIVEWKNENGLVESLNKSVLVCNRKEKKIRKKIRT